MKKYFYFWEEVSWYNVRVLNEREVRAWAGIMFLFAIIAFLVSCITWDFFSTKIIIIIFLVDFFIRVIINPRFSPTLILGRFFVANQTPEYVWAPQKRFAWSMWLWLAIFMFIMLVINNIINPITMLACLFCLILLFFETAFGICLGCKMYNKFHKEKAELCPGWVCEVKEKEKIQKINLIQIIILILFFIFIFLILNSNILKSKNPIRNNTQNLELQNQNWDVFGWIKNCMSSCGK